MAAISDTSAAGQWLSRGRNHPVVAGSVVVAASLLLVGCAVLPVAWALGGIAGLAGAGLAMLICLVCGVLAVVVTSLFDRPEMVLQQVVFGMGIRTVLPLAVCGVVSYRGGWLMEGGMVFYLLIFYFVVLLADTLVLLLRQRGALSKSAGVS